MFKLPPYDKCLHAIGGQIIALGTLSLGLPWSIGIVLVVAIGKEIWDRYHPGHTCDVWDAIATISGGVPIWGLALIYLSHRVTL